MNSELMISCRKYFSMLLMMGVILVMFMFTQIAKETISNYDTNSYAEEEAISGRGRWQPINAGIDGSMEYTADAGRIVLLVGREDNAVGRIASQWCLYTKRELAVCGSLADYPLDVLWTPEIVLLDSEVMDYTRDTKYLVELADQGIHMVFCNLPEPSVIRRQADLRTLLGIQEVRADQIEVEGVFLFDGFFLGGANIYRVDREEDEKRQDLQLEIPWYITLTGTKTYMVGILDELLEGEEDRNEYFPGIIWRSSYKDAKIFAVNGDYMSDMMGIGILSAITYELEPYAIYPIINAQNLLMTDFPGFADENAEVMQEVYSRTPRTVQQDIIWPTILSILQRGGWRMTALISPQYDYRDGVEPSASNYSFYLQQFKELGAEAGVSLRHGETVTLAEKLAEDEKFYRSLDSGYVYSAAYMDVTEFHLLDGAEEAEFISKIRTISGEYRSDIPLVFYYNDDITGQSIIGDARTHTYSENLRLRSLETALGYSNVKIDIHEAMWPESDETHWEKLYEDVASNLDTWWKPFSAFDRTTLTESDSRLRTFLNLDYKDIREGSSIFLDVEGMEKDGWFLLRTHGEAISEITGAEYDQVEKDAYLLHVLEDHVEIHLEKSRGVLKYTLPERD